LVVCILCLLPIQAASKESSSTLGELNSETSTLIMDQFKTNQNSWDSIVELLLKQRDRQLVERKRAEDAKRVEESKKVVVPPKPVPTQAPVVAASGSCLDWMTQAGVMDTSNAYTLILRESGCNPNAVNRSSGACGIPQALPCSKLGTNDPVEQIRWMQQYVIRRYGSWANAVAFHNANNWY
jgi:hypothetical protein